MTLKKLFGDGWYKLLEDYLKSDSFKQISNTLLEYYSDKREVIPSIHSPLYFKIFRELPPQKIKVIILGQDPYHEPNVYTGYAFDNANSFKLSPSLNNIFKEIDRAYPDNKEDLRFGNLDRWDLSRWVKQGVFLINTALSVEKGLPGAHTGLWRPFTIEWISRLSKDRNDLIWLLWGSHAQGYKKYITNPSHMIIETPHPSPLNRHGGFIGSDCFVKCNEQLKGLNKTEILW